MPESPKMPKIGEKWPEHPKKCFGGKIGSKVLQKKMAYFLPISGRNLAENVKKPGFLAFQRPHHFRHFRPYRPKNNIC